MKQFGIVMILLLSSLLVTAQHAEQNSQDIHQNGVQKSSIEKRQTEELAKLSKQLSLTAEQKSSIATLQKNINEASKAYRECGKKDPERKAKRTQMRKLKGSYQDDVKALLNAKQKKKYEAMLAASQQEGVKQSENGASQHSSGGGSSEEGGEE